LTKRAIESSVTLSTMSARARVVATVGVLWMLVVGGAVLMTIRNGEVTLVYGEQPCTGSSCVDESRPIVAVHTNHELAPMFLWIGVASAVALASIGLPATFKRRPARTDEQAYEVVPLGIVPEAGSPVSSPNGVPVDRRRKPSRRRAPALTAVASLPVTRPDSPESTAPQPAPVSPAGVTNG
jgi:hypothetical protein